MTLTLILIILALWLIPGLLLFGFSQAFWQFWLDDPAWSYQLRWPHFRVSLMAFIPLAGPIVLSICLAVERGGYSYGWILWPKDPISTL